MKRQRERKHFKFSVGDVVWVELDGEYSYYRNIMHKAVVKKVLPAAAESYYCHLVSFDANQKTSYDTWREYKMYFPDELVPLSDTPKRGEAVWFVVKDRMMDGIFLDGEKDEVYLKGIITGEEVGYVTCLFDCSEEYERWEETKVLKTNCFLIRPRRSADV